MRILRDKNKRRQYWEIKDRRLERQESRVLYHLKRFFRGQQRRILDRLPDDRKGLADTIFNKEREKELMAKAFLPVLEKVVREEGAETAQRFGIDFRVTASVEEFLQRRSNQMASDITDTTFKRIKADVVEGVSQGESYNEIGRRLESRYDQMTKYEGRGGTIARTEAGISTSQANQKAYEQAGVESKIWVAVLDGKTRPSHVAMDGDEVAISQPFSNGLMHPRDPSGAASEIVNCRCQH